MFPSKKIDDAEKNSHVQAIVDAIMASHKGFADGGLVEEAPEDESHEMEAMSKSGDDFLVDSPMEEGEDKPDEHKDMLSKIIAGLRSAR